MKLTAVKVVRVQRRWRLHWQIPTRHYVKWLSLKKRLRKNWRKSAMPWWRICWHKASITTSRSMPLQQLLSQRLSRLSAFWLRKERPLKRTNTVHSISIQCFRLLKKDSSRTCCCNILRIVWHTKYKSVLNTTQHMKRPLQQKQWKLITITTSMLSTRRRK